MGWLVMHKYVYAHLFALYFHTEKKKIFIWEFLIRTKFLYSKYFPTFFQFEMEKNCSCLPTWGKFVTLLTTSCFYYAVTHFAKLETSDESLFPKWASHFR